MISEDLVGRAIYKLRLLIFIMEEKLGFLRTVVFVSPPILDTPKSLNDGHVVSLGSP